MSTEHRCQIRAPQHSAGMRFPSRKRRDTLQPPSRGQTPGSQLGCESRSARNVKDFAFNRIRAETESFELWLDLPLHSKARWERVFIRRAIGTTYLGNTTRSLEIFGVGTPLVAYLRCLPQLKYLACGQTSRVPPKHLGWVYQNPKLH